MDQRVGVQALAFELFVINESAEDLLPALEAWNFAGEVEVAQRSGEAATNAIFLRIFVVLICLLDQAIGRDHHVRGSFQEI